MFRAEDCSEITRANVDPSAPPTPQMNLQVGSMDYLLLGYNPGARSVDLDVDKPMVVIMPKVTHTHTHTRTNTHNTHNTYKHVRARAHTHKRKNPPATDRPTSHSEHCSFQTSKCQKVLQLFPQTPLNPAHTHFGVPTLAYPTHFGVPTLEYVAILEYVPTMAYPL